MKKEEEFSGLEERIGYTFKNKQLLKHAMVHSSYVNEHGLNREACNERLEFLGDAVLELVSSDFLYSCYPTNPEGELTKLRASLVCEPALAFDARQFALPGYLLLGKGEDMTGGRTRDSIVSDACEALIGAIYLDSGLETAKQFIMNHILNDHENKKLFYDSKSILQEITQRDMDATPEYEIIAESGPAHAREFTAQVLVAGKVLGSGSGRTKKQAEQHASYQALIKLKDGR